MIKIGVGKPARCPVLGRDDIAGLDLKVVVEADDRPEVVEQV
jgi:hypothetical protein